MATLVIVVLVALLGTQTVTQRTPWLAPKGMLLSRASVLRERLHNPVVGPEDILPRGQGAGGKEKGDNTSRLMSLSSENWRGFSSL